MIEIDSATGLIVRVGAPEGRADLMLDDDHLVFPGFIDIHVHAREDPSGKHTYKETFRSAGEAAIRGGVTAFADMPNNPNPPVDDESYAAKRALTESCSVDVLLYAGLGPQTRPLSFAVPYKAYMGKSVGDLHFDSVEELREALPRYRGQSVAFHAEMPEILSQHRDAPEHDRRRPPEAEVEAIAAALKLSEEFHVQPQICHLSTAGGLELIRAARRRGQKITCEVTPHHLFYDQNNATAFRKPIYLQCNPPIRSRLDRIALLEAFRSGEINYLASDHAPHSLQENEVGVSGMPHLDTFGAFLFWLHGEGVTWQVIAAACSERPGKFLGRYLPRRYGKVEPGFAGSLSILRSGAQTVRRGTLKTRAAWSPFEGCEFSGGVSHTVVRGRLYTLDE